MCGIGYFATSRSAGFSGRRPAAATTSGSAVPSSANAVAAISIAPKAVAISRRFGMSRLVDELQLLACDLRGERKVLAVADDLRLAFAAEDVAHEFVDLRVERLAGPAIHEEEDIGVHRISPILHVLDRERDVRAAVVVGEGERLHLVSRRHHRHASRDVGDGELVLRELVEHLLAREVDGAVGVGLVGELAQLLVPLEAALEDARVELVGEVVLERIAEDPDRLVLPFAFEAELAPRADVAFGLARDRLVPLERGPAARALRPEDAVELAERELRDRVVLVHVDADRRVPTREREA